MSRSGLLHPKALPPFAALRAFEAVGRMGGIRKAAVSLSLDHAVVSRHVRQLEEWLGAALFKRSDGKMYFTDAGARYHERVSAILFDLALATLELTEEGAQQSLRVWCVPGFAAQWLSHQLAEFERLYPESRIELRPTDVAADLLMHEAEVDIRFYGDDWPPRPGGRGLHHMELARPPILAVASPALAERLGDQLDLHVLLRAPLLHEENDEQWRAWFRRNGLEVSGRIPGPLLWHAHMAISAARAGRGVALASTYLVGDDLRAGHLVELSFVQAYQPIIGAYYFITREDLWATPAVARLRRFLHHALADAPVPGKHQDKEALHLVHRGSARDTDGVQTRV